MVKSTVNTMNKHRIGFIEAILAIISACVNSLRKMGTVDACIQYHVPGLRWSINHMMINYGMLTLPEEHSHIPIK